MASNLSSKHQSLRDCTAWVPIIGSSRKHPHPQPHLRCSHFSFQMSQQRLEGRTGKVSEIPIHVGDSFKNEDIVVVVLPSDSIITCHHLHFLCQAKFSDVPTSKTHVKFISGFTGFTGESPGFHHPFVVGFFFSGLTFIDAAH